MMSDPRNHLFRFPQQKGPAGPFLSFFDARFSRRVFAYSALPERSRARHQITEGDAALH